MRDITVFPTVWKKFEKLARVGSALVVRGVVENNNGAISLVADHFREFNLGVTVPSRDFR